MEERFAGHYHAWRKSRVDCLDKYLQEEFLTGKNILELACGRADVSAGLEQKGAVVKGCDARQENLDLATQTYPSIPTFVYDGDTGSIDTKYDVIVHWGLLYHLNKDNHGSHVTNIVNNCDYLLLESEVCDSDDEECVEVQEDGYDQAYNGVGSRPSESYVENLLTSNGFQFKKILDPILNSDFHVYDWQAANTKEYKNGLRRFWICWNNSVSSPIKPELA